MKIAVLTDTNSGIDEAEAVELGVFVLPMPVIIDDEIYYEGINLTEESLCSLLEEGKKVTTSQPAMGDVIYKWDELLKDGYEEIIYIPMSSGLSSSCNCARAAAEDYEGKVHVVDNHRISVTLRAAVLKAVDMVKTGMSAGEIASYLEDDAYNSSIYVSVDKLDCLKRGGRVTPAAAAIATVLNIKPVLTIQGEKLDSYVKVRGTMHRCEIKMINGIKEDISKRFNQETVKTIHVGVAGFGISKEEEEHWTQLAREAFPTAHVYYDALPASVGTHTGPGAVGIGVSVDYREQYALRK